MNPDPQPEACRCGESAGRAPPIVVTTDRMVAAAASQRLTLDDSPDDFVLWLEKHRP